LLATHQVDNTPAHVSSRSSEALFLVYSAVIPWSTQEDDGRHKRALKMPIYPATLQHIPCLSPAAALKIGGDVLAALQHMHKCGFGHCDVKAPNIFINYSGDALLGDYGAVRELGADADEKTLSHVPVDPPTHVDVDHATPALDHLLLAVTLLERMQLLQLQGPHQLRMASVQLAVARVTDTELRAFFKQLLQQ
jgi:serine/threonine protein kinase